MPQRTRKSTAYYTIIVCLALIAIPSLYALLWQPSFAAGYISIPFREGSLLFSLWTFIPAACSLLLFTLLVAPTVKKNYPLNHVLFLVLLGLTFILCLAPLGIGSRTSAVQSHNAKKLSYYLVAALKVLMAITLLLLIVQWSRSRRAGRFDPTTINR